MSLRLTMCRLIFCWCTVQCQPLVTYLHLPHLPRTHRCRGKIIHHDNALFCNSLLFDELQFIWLMFWLHGFSLCFVVRHGIAMHYIIMVFFVHINNIHHTWPVNKNSCAGTHWDRRRRQRRRARVAASHSHRRASMAAGRPMPLSNVTGASPEDRQ